MTQNFSIVEVTTWARHQSMNDADRKKATEMAMDAMNDEVEANAIKIANELQKLRDKINTENPEFGGKLGLRILSWFRPKKWELYRKRSGNSQHTKGHAVDFIIVGCEQKKAQELTRKLFNDLKDWNGGLAIMERNNNIGFIHLDLGKKRRWNY